VLLVFFVDLKKSREEQAAFLVREEEVARRREEGMLAEVVGREGERGDLKV